MPPPTVDETARFIAGLPVTGVLAPLMEMPAWQEHARSMDEAWTRKQNQQIEPIRAWMWANAQEFYRSSDPVFYMFAGPDFLYANTFFPYASSYILAAREPIGEVGDLTRVPPDQVALGLAGLRSSMNSILRFQYFITKDMREEFGRSVSGTLPILYVFLARMNQTVLSVERLTSPAEGVKITFRDALGRQSQTQSLYYFKTDLSGGGQSAFLKWCAVRGPGLSLLKAASFLMHGDGFSGVRNFLLGQSKVIIQDDSGIPLRAFPQGWAVNVYGRYVPHRTDFAKYTQPDLLQFVAQNPPGPLGFAFGYHWQKDEGVLMLATPNGGGPPRPEIAPLRPEVEVRRALPADQ
jgi:hypothetical protein